MRVPRERRFSPSQLGAFLHCPRKYSFQYVERVEVEREPSPHFVFGNAIHAALDSIFRIPPGDRTLELMEEAFRGAWRADPERAGAFATREDERRWGLKGLELLSRVAAGDDFHSAVPRALEDWAQVMISGERQLFGRIDRVDDHPDGDGVIVIDYKTGKCRIAEGGLGDEVQAQVYALAVRATLETAVREVRFMFLEAGVERSWTPDDLEGIEASLTELVDSIDATEEFVAAPSRLCGWCDYLDLCDAGRAEVAGRG